MSECKACQAVIDWALTPRGAHMPVDRDSAGQPGGDLAVWRDELGNLRCRALQDGEELRSRERQGQSHWSTCGNARPFRD